MSRDRTDVIVSDRLSHMIEAAKAVAQFIDGMDRESFARDLKTMYAVRAAFITIGEASGAIPDAVKARYAGVPWREVRHYRNFLIHVHDRIEAGPLFETATRDLPALCAQLQAMRSDFDAGTA